MKIALTRDEVAEVVAAHIATIVNDTVLATDMNFDKYGVNEFVVWESKKEPKDPYDEED